MDSMQSGIMAVLVLGLLGLTLWWLRSKGLAHFALKLPIGAADRRMKLLERISLTPHHSLHLVQVEGRTVLVAASPGGCSFLETIAPGEERKSAR